MKRGYLWLDWVELGVRGWDLMDYGSCGVGASLVCTEVTGAFLSYHKKVGFRVHVNASPKDAARIWNDLLNAGLFIPRGEAHIESHWVYAGPPTEPGTFGSSSTQTATLNITGLEL